MISTNSKTNAGAIANEFIYLSDEQGGNLTNLKLMKICYIAHGLSLSILGEPAFSEQVEAWQYGPVIPSLYHEFKHFGSGKITNYKSTEIENGFTSESYVENKLTSENLKKIVKLTWNLYGKMDAIKLVDLTHEQGTPWFVTYYNNSQVIDNKIIKKYYDKFLINLREKLKK